MHQPLPQHTFSALTLELGIISIQENIYILLDKNIIQFLVG